MAILVWTDKEYSKLEPEQKSISEIPMFNFMVDGLEESSGCIGYRHTNTGELMNVGWEFGASSMGPNGRQWT